MHALLNRRLKAYGLIEIMIVLMVIGFLLKNTIGQFWGRLDDAKVKSSLAYYNKILAAVLAFQDRYGYLPGDFPYASRDLGTNTPNGEGTNELTGDGLDTPTTSAASRFWYHLHKANLLTDYAIKGSSESLKFGRGAPKSDFSHVGFTVAYNPENWGGHWIVLGEQSGNSGTGSAFTPEQARLFLQQMNVEDPQSGNIRIAKGKNSKGTCLNSSGDLSLQNEGKACIVYIKLTDS